MAKAPPREQKRPENLKARRPRTAPAVEQVPAAKPLAKSQDPAYMKFTTYIPVDVQRAVKSRLVGQGRELSDLVEQLLREWNGRADHD